MSKLKIWNGPGWGHRRYDKDKKHILDPTGIKFCERVYVCDKSKAHAVKIINEAVGYRVVDNSKAQKYWSSCWGTCMHGVCDENNPEIGVWTIQTYNDVPKRIYPAKDKEEQ